MPKFLKVLILGVAIGIFLTVIDKILFENFPGLLYGMMGFIIAFNHYNE